MRTLWRLIASLFAWSATAGSAADKAMLYINYSAAPPPKDLLTYPLCILDLHAQADLKPGQRLGHQFLAYLSAVEVANGSPSLARATERQVPLVGENPAWASRLMQVGSEAWRSYLLEDGAAVAMKAGFDGFFIDTIDSTSLIPDRHERRNAAGHIVSVIKEMHKRWPKKKIIINRGFDLLPELKSQIHGLMVESVFQTFDAKQRRYVATEPEGSEWLETKIEQAQGMGLTVYAVDYVSPTEQALANATAKKLAALGAIPLVTTPELLGRVLAPPAH